MSRINPCLRATGVTLSPSPPAEMQLVPAGRAYDALAEDYERMLDGGMLLDDEEEFDEIARRCADVEARINRS